MTLTALQKFPGPYFGGKRMAAPAVWQALGDVSHYVEPFGGSCAVLLERPHPCNRPYFSETVNDQDALLVNALRAMQLAPQATAEAASWLITEADLMARHLALLTWIRTQEVERLMADPLWCDPQIAGWWLYGLSAWIGSGWCAGQGPWIVDPVSGRVCRQPGAQGVSQKLPHLGHDGRGVHRPGTREPGVWRQRPHLGNDGEGVHHAGTREPGVWRDTERPAPADETSEDWQRRVEADYAATEGFHPLTMPELRRWFAFLSARLRHVRIVNGDWRRVLTSGALFTLSVRKDPRLWVGAFIDPPYASTERDPGLYRIDNAAGADVAAEVRAWCLAQGDTPQLRIVLAGFAGEGHEALEAHGWTPQTWFTPGHLRGGMAHGEHQQHRERLWLSPHCLRTAPAVQQLGLWA